VIAIPAGPLPTSIVARTVLTVEEDGRTSITETEPDAAEQDGSWAPAFNT
jgi:hypothetical protein